MDVDRVMIAAIRANAEKLGGVVQLASVCNVDNSTLGKYCNGLIKTITDENWEKLYPHILGDLPNLPRYVPRSQLDTRYGQHAEAVVAERPQPYTVTRIKRVPIYGLAMAKGVAEWHGDMVPDSEHELDTVEIPDDGRRYAAFRIEGDSMEPRIHDGDLVLADLDIEPQPGNIVLAKWDDTVMCKRYRRYGRQIVLESLNPRYEPVSVKPTWMLRVKRVMFEV